jgi:glutathione peroxidase
MSSARSSFTASVIPSALAGLALAACLAQGTAAAATNPPASVSATAAGAECPALLKRELPRLQDEKPQNLCQYAGKVVLVVNTASFCGFTPQYQGLESLYSRYQARGLVVLGFPSNDFGSQEPGNSKEIANFCENTFGVKFPMFSKTRVKAGSGGPVEPLFVELSKRTGQVPGWNFHKYLVSRDGRAVQSFSSSTDPQDARLVASIEKLLATP